MPLHSFDWSLAHFGVLPWNPTVFCLISSFFAVALWLSVELMVQVWFTFKRHRTLYYWSMLITTFGIICHTIAFILKLFVPMEDQYGSTVLAKIGWVSNTTGFSVVLYSRLHLVLHDSCIPLIVLTFIIVDAILFHTPIVIFAFALDGPNAARWVAPMAIAERVMIVAFTIQETLISSIYTYATAQLLKSGYSVQLRNVLVLLVLAQLAVFSSDMVMVVVDYLDMFTLKASMHPFIYAVKLKIEFVVLNQLRGLVRHGMAPGDLDEFPTDDGQRSQSSQSSWSVAWKRLSRLSRCSSFEKTTRVSIRIHPVETAQDVETGQVEMFPAASILDAGMATPAPEVERQVALQKTEEDVRIEAMERLYLGNLKI